MQNTRMVTGRFEMMLSYTVTNYRLIITEHQTAEAADENDMMSL